MITDVYRISSLRIASTFPSGRSPASKLSRPACAETVLACSARSPVSITVRWTPSRRNRAINSGTPGRNWSLKVTAPAKLPSTET
jgi:hypothetical protein